MKKEARKFVLLLIFRCNLQIHAQEMLCSDTDEEGNHCYTDADNSHFGEAGFERFILRYGCVVGEHSDNQNYDCQH